MKTALLLTALMTAFACAPALAACERGGLSEAQLKPKGFSFEKASPQGKAILFRPATVRFKGEPVGCAAASIDGEVCFASAFRQQAAYLSCERQDDGRAQVGEWRLIDLKTGQSKPLHLPGIMPDLTSPLFLSDRTVAYVALDAEHNRYECVLYDVQTQQVLEHSDMNGPLPGMPPHTNEVKSNTVWLHAKRLSRTKIGCYQNDKLLATLSWKRKQP